MRTSLWHKVSHRFSLIAWLLVASLMAACGDSVPGRGATSGGSVSASAAAEKSVVQTTGEVYRFAKTGGAYFFTGSAGERDLILANFPEFRYEGVGFLRLESGEHGVPVYRFANLANGGYFYTASADERDAAQKNRPDLRFEGSSFNVIDPQTPNALPVLRLASLVNGAYLYTANPAEVSAAVSTGLWRAEGVAFYTPATAIRPPGEPAPAPLACSIDATAIAGACVCSNRSQVYDKTTGTCRAPCPAGAALTGGACVCGGSQFAYDNATNACLAVLTCPGGSSRLGDSCLCRDGGRFDATAGVCRPACPVEAAQSGSACICNASGWIFQEAGNRCVPAPSAFELQVLSGRPAGCADFQDGCGGGGDGADGADGSAGAGADGVGASDGQLAGAIVEVWRPLDGGLKLLGTAPVGALSGMITLRAGSYAGPLWLVFKGQPGGTYFDEAAGALRSFGVGDELNLLLPSRTVRRNYGATVLTDAAFRRALALWSTPGASREQNIAAILTDARIEQVNVAIRNLINRYIPIGLLLKDITRMPQMVGGGTSANSLPNNENGAYALLLASFAVAAQNFSTQVAATRSGLSPTTTPGRDFTRQLVLDLADGIFDAQANGVPVASPQNRVYALSGADPSLTAFGMVVIPTLSAALTPALQTAADRYAAPGLIQVVTPPAPVTHIRPEVCGTSETISYSDGSLGCCYEGALLVMLEQYYCQSASQVFGSPIEYFYNLPYRY